MKLMSVKICGVTVIQSQLADEGEIAPVMHQILQAAAEQDRPPMVLLLNVLPYPNLDIVESALRQKGFTVKTRFDYYFEGKKGGTLYLC